MAGMGLSELPKASFFFWLDFVFMASLKLVELGMHFCCVFSGEKCFWSVFVNKLSAVTKYSELFFSSCSLFSCSVQFGYLRMPSCLQQCIVVPLEKARNEVMFLHAS